LWAAALEVWGWRWLCTRAASRCDVYESVAEVREIGVGITLLPHAMRELAALGLQSALEAAGD
jgi:2-polyprenyl-6-methoxyphenol hydroxylase-like FAD-dependent oxidoreductase